MQFRGKHLKEVNSVEEMIRICKQKRSGQAEFLLLLVGGFLSVKDITFSENKEDYRWTVYNNIDDSFEEFDTDEDLLRKTHIGLAMERGAFMTREGGTDA